MKCRYFALTFAAFTALVLTLGSTALAQTWTQLAPIGGPPQAVGNAATRVYDPDSNRSIYYAPCCFHTTEVWALAHADGLGGTPEWINIVPASASGPPGRHAQAAAYDSINNTMVIFSGCGGGCFPVRTDVWVLANADGFDPLGNPAAASWSQLVPTSDPIFGAPAGRVLSAAIYDPSSNQMILFGGQNGGGFAGATFPEVWRLTHANGLGGTPVWSKVATAGTFPPGQFGSAAAYDAANNRMIVFSGAANGTGASTNAVWALSNANGTGAGTPTWTNVVADGAAGSPPGAGGGGLQTTYDPVNSRLIYLDFLNGVNVDSWVLHHANGLGGPAAWQQLVTGGAPSSQLLLLPSYNATSNRLTAVRNTPSGVGAEAWVLTNANGDTNQPPVANAGPDQTMVECASHSGTAVTLDGSASSDPDGDTLTYEWKDENANVVGTAASVIVTVPLGTHAFTLKVRDPGELSSTATTHVTVQDTKAPTLTLSTNTVAAVLPTASATGATANLSGIASATDTCDPAPVITNNAPATFSVGITIVTFTATDASGNSSQENLSVQVRYNFNGYFTPVLNNGGSIFKSGRTVPVKFQLTAADGTIVSNAVATLQVAMVAGVITGTTDFTDATASGGSNTGNFFRFDPTSGQYIYNLNTTGFASGTYGLRATMNDGTTHDALVSIR